MANLIKPWIVRYVDADGRQVTEGATMFVRWKKRERMSRRGGRVRPTGGTLLVAALVTSERRGGKPRQRIVAYLGSIDAEALGYVRRRQAFWESAGRKLDALGLSRSQRQAVEK